MRPGKRGIAIRYAWGRRRAATIATWIVPLDRFRRDGVFLRWRGLMVAVVWRADPVNTKAALGAAVNTDPEGLD